MNIRQLIGKYTTGVTLALILLSTATLIAAPANPRSKAFEDYVRRHYSEAIRQMERHGIPASITMAQGLVETGAGKSSLATVHNNHFGIKCHASWRGKRTYKTDDLPDECFRSYGSWQESYEDHSVFLKGRRYQSLYALSYDDYRGWARGLQSAGYATNKGYANKLIKIIEDYELYTLDQGKAPSWLRGGERVSSTQGRYSKRRAKDTDVAKPMRPIYMSYGLLYVLADPHDTFEKVGEDLDMSPSRLARYNDAPENFPLREGDIIYLEPKLREAIERYKTHTVVVGDSMHSISQRYGIKLSRLYKLNNKDDEYIPEEGDVLRLR